MKVIIAAAGTGGHVNPGIAIANKIMKEEPQSKILFIGTSRGVEKDLVTRAGYELKTLDAYGLSKKISVENIKRTVKTIESIKKAKKIIKNFKPDIVIGTGGYICGPVIIAAESQKIPTVLHESNAFPGLAVKMLSKKVDLVLLGFKEAKSRLTKAKKIVVTGTPSKVKKMEISNNQKKMILEKIGLNSKLPTVLIFGGSQGSKRINEAVLELLRENKKLEYQIIWSVGKNNYKEITKKIEKENVNKQNLKILPYIYNMEEIMNVSDLILSRSGAITITEISNVGKPAIFIPLPNVSNNHQEYNAKVLEKVGAAKIILDYELNGNKLSKTLEVLILNNDKLEEMSKNSRKIAIEAVDEKIYKEISKIVV